MILNSRTYEPKFSCFCPVWSITFILHYYKYFVILNSFSKFCDLLDFQCVLNHSKNSQKSLKHLYNWFDWLWGTRIQTICTEQTPKNESKIERRHKNKRRKENENVRIINVNIENLNGMRHSGTQSLQSVYGVSGHWDTAQWPMDIEWHARERWIPKDWSKCVMSLFFSFYLSILFLISIFSCKFLAF